jgi:hypothetical protein
MLRHDHPTKWRGDQPINAEWHGRARSPERNGYFFAPSGRGDFLWQKIFRASAAAVRMRWRCVGEQRLRRQDGRAGNAAALVATEQPHRAAPES